MGNNHYKKPNNFQGILPLHGPPHILYIIPSVYNLYAASCASYWNLSNKIIDKKIDKMKT